MKKYFTKFANMYKYLTGFTGSEDINNPHAGLLTLANTATALTSSQPDGMTSSEKNAPGDKSKTGKCDPTAITHANQTGSAATSAVSVPGDSIVTTTASQNSTTLSQSVTSIAPVVSTNQIGPVMAGAGGTTTSSMLPANQGPGNNAPTLIFQNGQLLLVPPAQAQAPPLMQQPISTDSQSQGEAGTQPSSSASTSTASIATGVPSQPAMPAGPGMRMPGIMGLPGSFPGQGQVLPNPTLGAQQQQQIVIGPNGQPMLIQNPNAPVFNNQSQPSTDSNTATMTTNNQLTGSQPPGANQNALGMPPQQSGPNQFPNALILPNGQVSNTISISSGC